MLNNLRNQLNERMKSTENHVSYEGMQVVRSLTMEECITALRESKVVRENRIQSFIKQIKSSEKYPGKLTIEGLRGTVSTIIVSEWQRENL